MSRSWKGKKKSNGGNGGRRDKTKTRGKSKGTPKAVAAKKEWQKFEAKTSRSSVRYDF